MPASATVRAVFMSYIRGDEREQGSFLPPVLDDYVGPDALVRVIDAFVGALDFGELGFERSLPAATGRPGYDPRDLLRLYLYGYLNEVRSSRRLERECRRNVEMMWLLGRLVPDFKTIADFRRDNSPSIATVGLVGACRAFVLFCRDQGLTGGRTVAIDGSKFRAAASHKRVMGRREIDKMSARIDAQVAEYLAELDEADAQEAEPAEAARVRSALEALRSRRAALDAMRDDLANSGRSTLVEGETDARPMGVGAGRKPPSYNLQTAADTETSLILHHDVTTEATDNRLLHPMAREAKQVLRADRLRIVADAGYSNGAQAAACEREGIEPCVPANRATNNKGDFFDRRAFIDDAENDTYTCPAGRTLVRKEVLPAKHIVRYVARECSGCVLKPRCTSGSRRYLKRHLHDDALERMNARVVADPGLMRLRRARQSTRSERSSE
jgi:transposase